MAHTGVDMASLGYWSMPFILEDYEMDNHKMITYSVPLVNDGVIYGVVGTEVSVSYLCNTYFRVQDLNRQQTAGYAIAVDNGDGTYENIAGKVIFMMRYSVKMVFLSWKVQSMRIFSR